MTKLREASIARRNLKDKIFVNHELSLQYTSKHEIEARADMEFHEIDIDLGELNSEQRS